MKKRKKLSRGKKARTKVQEGARHASLLLATFEEFANNFVRELVDKLPRSFAREDLVQILHAYLDFSVRKIQLGGRFPLKVRVIDIFRYYDPEKYPALFEQRDFRRWAEPWLTDGNLTMLDEPMQKLRKRAGEMGIDWSVAAPIVGKVSDRYRPDQRPVAVQRGEFCEQVIGELRRIRECKSEFRTYEELERIFPSYEVVRVLKHLPFDSDDREMLASPNRWERTVTYANGILHRYYGKSLHTIRQDRKRFKASTRTSRPS